MEYTKVYHKWQHCLLQVKFILQLVFFLLVCSEGTTECDGPAMFGIHPVDAHIQEGENAVFTCTVMQFNPSTDKLTWHVSPDEYLTEISNHYDDSTLEFTSVITVYDIRRKDQSFKCVLRSLHSGYLLQTCSSHVARLRVEYFPRDYEMSCGSGTLEGLHEGSVLELWCMIQEGKPSVNLSWKVDESNSSFTEHLVESNGEKLVLKQEILLNHDLHTKSLKCVASSGAKIFQNHEVHCLIGPLLVRHKPQVAIHKSQHIASVDDPDIGQVELNCHATSYPENKTFTWLCSPGEILSGCHNATSKTILLGAKDNNTSITDIDLEVSCSVTNAEGTTTDVFSLLPKSYRKANGSSVMGTSTADPEISDIGLCQSVTPRLNLLNKSVNWEMFSFEVHMVCFPDCIETDGTNVFISWLVNENKIEPDSIDILHSFSPPTSSVTVKGYFKEYDIINVTCEIRSHNVTYRNIVNISFVKHPCVTAHVNTQLITHPLVIETLRNNSGKVLGQPEMVTSALQTEKGQTEIEKGDWLKLSGIQVIIFTTIAVLVGLLLTACICAFCTVCIFKYLQQANSIDTNRCHEQKSSTNCVSFRVSQQNSSLNQNIMSISNENAMYEKPVTPPPYPPLASPNVAYKDNHVREGAHFFEKESSRSLSVIYDCTNSITSSIFSNTSSDISVPSGYSEWSGHKMPTELQEDVDLGNITCTSTEHVYDNAGIIRMHMFPRSASFSRLPRQNDMIKTEFPTPALPGSGAQESNRI